MAEVEAGFLALAMRRRSVRSFADRPVERDVLERCLEAARLAPSSSNSQPWKFVVVVEPELRRRLARETFGAILRFNRFVTGAAALVAVVEDPARTIPRLGGLLRKVRYSLIDVGIAAEHFCLQAASEGLGTCLLGWLHERAVKRLLGVPAGKRVPLMIAVGYPAGAEPRPRGRRRLSEMSSFDGYR